MSLPPRPAEKGPGGEGGPSLLDATLQIKQIRMVTEQRVQITTPQGARREVGANRPEPRSRPRTDFRIPNALDEGIKTPAGGSDMQLHLDAGKDVLLHECKQPLAEILVGIGVPSRTIT